MGRGKEELMLGCFDYCHLWAGARQNLWRELFKKREPGFEGNYVLAL
jgi:hypothetical protein